MLDTEAFEAQTGYPIRSAWRTPGEVRPLPPADAIAVVPDTHLLPSSEARTSTAIDDVFTEAEAKDDGEAPAVQGTSAPPVKPMCPGRLTALPGT